ncbi:RNA polymerase sigma factor [Enemella dayhoffiae]|uniref:RNA polymerase sigma factor n=1 Tax=Enemella dayhoffiae TaxID=2016507 RepID=UPI001E2D8EF6|nr:sigma-70 family RNA polymerase sigma factor [Enemella dayhoffiae]
MDSAGDETQAVALLDRVRHGDRHALEDLLAVLQPRVVRICRRMLPHPADAEEAAQDALLVVATRWEQWNGHGAFLGWVGVVAANSARATYRSMRRKFAESAQTPSLPEAADPRTTSVIAGSRIDLLDALEALEEARPTAVEAFVLRDLGGLSYEEVAEQTGGQPERGQDPDPRRPGVHAGTATGEVFMSRRFAQAADILDRMA